MAIARETVRLGLAARGHGKLKVRQPLRAAVVVAAGEERAAIERMRRHRARRAQRQGAALRVGGRRARLLRGQAQLPQPRAALRQADAAGRRGDRGAGARARGRRAARGAPVAIAVDGHDHELGPDDLSLAMQPLAGYQLEREGSHAVALELRARRRAARRGPRPRGRPLRPERAQGGGPRGGGPDRARARRRRGAARRRPRRTSATSRARRSPRASPTTARWTARRRPSTAAS